MNKRTHHFEIQGPIGILQAARDMPEVLDNAASSRGVAVIAHPHPMFGGTMDNKVVQTIARACVQSGLQTVRFNFRGVGPVGTPYDESLYDEGRGELQDLLAVIEAVYQAGSPLVLAGFSFGAFVVAQAVQYLLEREGQHFENDLKKLLLIGIAASRFNVAPVSPSLHAKTLLIHGEIDDTVPLSAAMDWARPQLLPITVVPNVGHFFHGQLPLLKSLVLRHLC